MAVLVDEARWEWRGTVWAHLVSDESYEELHELARVIGKRRLSFQGDHYDVDVVDRKRAIEAGAAAVDSRQLVRRLVASGLRRGNAKPSWEPLASSPPGSAPREIIDRLTALDSEGAIRLAEAIAHIEEIATIGEIGAWGDKSRLVVLIDIGAGVPTPEPGPWTELADEVVIGGARVNGDRSLELFVAR